MSEEQSRESVKVEKLLVGKRVAIRTFDWQRQIVGKVQRVERYNIVIKLDDGGTLIVMKHSIGTIALIKE
jgi:hypothetical protein